MKYVWLTATAVWFIFMTYLSHQKGAKTAETSLRLAELLGNRDLNSMLRKAAHVFLFLILAVLLSLTLSSWYLDQRFIVLIFLWCVFDEVSKTGIEGRHCAIGDVGLNMLGGGIGVVVGMIIKGLL